MRILLVEDDDLLAQSLSQSLHHARFTVNWVGNGKDALSALSIPEHDLVILDLGLPDMDGIQVMRQIRQQRLTIPIIILTARDTLAQKVQGLDYGADDYLAKPFEMIELLARIRVIERRLGTATSAIIRVDGVTLDTTTHTLKVNDQAIELAKKEYMVLKVLMENAGRIQSRAQIENRLYEWGEEIASNAVEVHIHNVRKRLPQSFIKTIRGVGYLVNKT